MTEDTLDLWDDIRQLEQSIRNIESLICEEDDRLEEIVVTLQVIRHETAALPQRLTAIEHRIGDIERRLHPIETMHTRLGPQPESTEDQAERMRVVEQLITRIRKSGGLTELGGKEKTK